MSTLNFRYEPDLEDKFEGRLWLSVSTERFSGRGFFWAHREDLSEFATQLGAYPLRAAGHPIYRAGYNDAEGADAVLLVSIEPVGGVGDLLVAVVVSDLYERDQRLSVGFKTTYMEVASFREHLLSLGAGKTAEATLSGR